MPSSLKDIPQQEVLYIDSINNLFFAMEIRNVYKLILTTILCMYNKIAKKKL